jgi:hypothetical protein
MDSLKIHDQKFTLKSAGQCEKAIEYIAGHLETLAAQKTEIETALKNTMLDFEDSEEQRAALDRAAKESAHFQGLLERIETRRDELFQKEFKARASKEIERVKKQSADLAELCLKEIPTAGRKIALIAAILTQHQKEIEEMIALAKQAEVEITHNSFDPFRAIDENAASSDTWLNHLSIPLIDEQPNILKFWPLPDLARAPETYQDNPDVMEEALSVLHAKDPAKAAEQMFKKIAGRAYDVRPVDHEPAIVQDHSKPLWFERPRQEWHSLLKPESVTERVRQLGNLITFWLELPEQRRYGAFIHLLSPEQRAQVIEKLPEEERQQYLDHLMAYASDSQNDEPDMDEQSAQAA